VADPLTRPTTERPKADRRRGGRCGARTPPRRGEDGREGPRRGAEEPDPGGCEGTIPGGWQEPPRVLVHVTRSNDPIRGRGQCEAEAKHTPFTSRVGVGPERGEPRGTPRRSEGTSRFIRPCVSTVLGGHTPPATATSGTAEHSDSTTVFSTVHFGDPWAPDPGCYLTDAEIGLDKAKQAELERSGEIFQMPY